MIDTTDLNKVLEFPYSWFSAYNNFTKSFYVHASIHPKKDNIIQKRNISLHYYLMNSESLDDIQIDHINHDTLDNRKCNLRISNKSDNYTNKNGKNSNNKSGYRNVFWNTKIGKWTVSLCKNYKRIYVGDYDDVHEAGFVAEKARQKYYGEYAGKKLIT